MDRTRGETHIGGNQARYTTVSEVFRIVEDGLHCAETSEGSDEGPEMDQILGRRLWCLCTVA